VRKSSASPPTRGQPHRPSSSSDAHVAHGASPFQKATPEELDYPTSQQITREQNPSLNGLPSRPTGASDRPRRVPEEDDDGEGSREHHAKLVAPGALSGKEVARLEDGHLIELERQLSETLVAKTERDRRIAQLTDDLALKSALLEQAAEEKKRAGLELRELQAKLDESLLSRDHALEQAQSALQKASCAAEANEQSQRELAGVHAKLEARESELAAFCLRLAETENGCAKSKAEADTYRTQTATGLVNTDEVRVVHRLMERMQAMEAEIASLRWNEKSFEMTECSNEG
jgi:chromosome segregation ATPase